MFPALRKCCPRFNLEQRRSTTNLEVSLIGKIMFWPSHSKWQCFSYLVQFSNFVFSPSFFCLFSRIYRTLNKVKEQFKHLDIAKNINLADLRQIRRKLKLWPTFHPKMKLPIGELEGSSHLVSGEWPWLISPISRVVPFQLAFPWLINRGYYYSLTGMILQEGDGRFGTKAFTIDHVLHLSSEKHWHSNISIINSKDNRSYGAKSGRARERERGK